MKDTEHALSLFTCNYRIWVCGYTYFFLFCFDFKILILLASISRDAQIMGLLPLYMVYMVLGTKPSASCVPDKY